MQQFREDPHTFIRQKVVQGFTLCECNDGVAARKQLFREAIYDTDRIVIRLAIRGAADLQIADMVQRVVQLLDNDDENVRHTAATAVQAYGREVAGYANEIRAAAAKEKNAEIREIFRSSLRGIE